MADETQPEVQPDPAAPAAAPAEEPAPAPEAPPDPSATSTTSSAPSEPTSGETPKKAVPVRVDLRTRRSDDDALLGSWAEVVSGPYQGRKGHYLDDVSYDPETGYPVEVLLRTRDALNELLSVKYSDIRPTEYTGGR